MTISLETAIAILESGQEAWAAGSIEGVLDKYIDDLVYTTNTAPPDGGLVTVRGKEALRRRFRAAMDAIESRSRFESIRCEDGLVRTRMAAVLRHRESGHILTLTLRQVIRFQGFRIAEQADFHDAAKLRAFWALIGDPLARLKSEPQHDASSGAVGSRHPNVKA